MSNIYKPLKQPYVDHLERLTQLLSQQAGIAFYTLMHPSSRAAIDRASGPGIWTQHPQNFRWVLNLVFGLAREDEDGVMQIAKKLTGAWPWSDDYCSTLQQITKTSLIIGSALRDLYNNRDQPVREAFDHFLEDQMRAKLTDRVWEDMAVADVVTDLQASLEG